VKKLKSGISFFLSACIMIALLCPITAANGADGSAGPIIADHNNATLADLEAIPVEWINKAKSDLHIYYNHTSHGSQVADGMTGLVGFKGGTYAWNSSGSNGALHLADTYSTDLGNSDWPSITRNYLNSHTNINVVMWSWCGQVSSAKEADINSYLSNMSQLEKDYPNVKFVYMTGHTDGTGTNGNLHVRNEQIRRYCRTNNKILFDFADIESYDPNGNYYLDKGVNDECYYDSDGNGSKESNWATAWQNSHTENVDWYRCSSAHSQPINANMKAYAAWYLWARLAGWDGTTGGGGTPPDIDATAPSVPANLTGSAVSQTAVTLNWTASTDNKAVAGYRIYRNGTEIGTSLTNSYSDTGLTAGTQYAYRVSAYDAAGNQSAQCAAVNITTQSAPQSGTSVSQLTARHYEGQTILTWSEIPEVAAAVFNTMTIQQVRGVRTSFNKISYRIYRSNSPIKSVAGLSPIKTVGVLTGWDDEYYGRENGNIDNQNCPRFVVDKDTNDVAAAPVSAGTAVSAYNPASAGTAYYAVTVVRNGVEETQIGSGNTVTVNETVGQGIPILQKVETVKDYYYTDGISTHYYYTRWESPPNSNVHGMPADYKVIVPESYVPGRPTPVNLSFHAWGSNMHVQAGWWYNFDKGTISITTNQIPYDWWTGYHEKYGIGERSQQNWASGVVRPYTQNRLNSFFDWAASRWSLDRSRTIAAGVSMGGSGSIMYGIRNPDRVAWVNSWVGVHVPAESPTFKSSYQMIYGDVNWQIKYQDGVTPAFSYFDDDWYLRNHISDETPFITFSNGKNDSAIGWSQAVKFVNALQDTKRPHIFYWGQSGHSQRTLNPPDINGNRSESEHPIDIRVVESLPAFTNCSLDDDPGNGDVNNGDASGQINAYMFWKTEDIVDTQNKWEMTIGVVQTAPAQSCTVSLTPRRLQNFDPVPGKVYRWTNTSLSNNTQIQSGTVTCDSNGLLTINNLAVNRITSTGGGNRIAIFTDDGTVPANNQPVLALIGARTVKAGETLTITVNASDSDPGDTLVYSACTSPSGSLPQGASFDTASRTFTWTPGNGQKGTYTLRFTVSDGKSTDSEDVVITVTDSTESLYDLRLKYIPAIDASMKANLRAIKLRGDAERRSEGVLGQWGDSITYSQAYLGSMASWGLISTPPSNGHDYEPILLWMGASPNSANNPLHNFKGESYGNYSGWRITDGLAAISDAVEGVNPSWSLTMFGTNDITSWDAQSFEKNLERFIQINIDEGIIPVLSTIPPRTNYNQQVGEANTVIRRVAQKLNIPLVDLYGLFMELHPNDWSTVLLGDGVHPSHTYDSGNLSDAALRNDGYNIRSVLTLDMAEKLKRIVFDNGPADGAQSPILTVSSPTHPYKTMTVGLSATFNIHHDSGPVPGSYSWVLDQYPDTIPDTVPEGSSTTVTVTAPSDGTWYFHVRGSSGGTWGPAAHYSIIASRFPKIVIRRTAEDPGAVKDTYISQLWGGSSNYGAAYNLNIYNDDAVRRTQGLFRFDLTGVDKNGITSAKLKLYTSSPVTKDFDYEIYAINSTWTEGTGTWSNGDHSGIIWSDGLAYGNAPVATGTIAQGKDCIEADVTAQVLAWLNGTPNNGFMLQHLELWGALDIISSENGLKEMRPSLTIEYDTPGGQWNYVPVLSTIGARTVNEGANLTFTVSATDRDQGDTLTYSLSPVSPSTLPSGISFNSATRVFSWTPGYDQSGTYTLRFTVSDGKQIDYEDVVITVRNMSNTPPQGRNVRVTTIAELRSAITNARDGDTILIADGEYRNGNPLILDNVDDIAIRSESNDPTRVILRGRTSFTGTGSYDELDDILRIGDCINVHISGLTLTQAHGYGIKLELDGDSNPNSIYIENCRFIDIGTRHIKGTKDSNSSTKRIKGGAIRNCYFENTVTPPSTGGWHFDGNYIGAIDMMSLDGWVIEDNEFRNIQGNSGEGRSAIMIWQFSENLTIQRNRIINCDRGITLGLPGFDLGGGRHVRDAIVRNNFILPGSKTGYQSDAGIECSDVDNVRIYNNTVWRLNNDYNGRGIRFIQNIANTQMVNNLVYGRLVFDNDLTISRNEKNLSGNISSGYVVDVSTGDLHLTASAANAINNGVQLAEVTDDIDGNARGTTQDIGADEYVTSGGGTTNPGGGTTNPGGGSTNPGGGTTNPGGGTTNPGGSVIITPPVDENIPDTTATPPSATITSFSGTTATQSLVVSGGTAIAATNAEQLNSAMKQAAPGKGGIRSVTLTLPEIKNACTYQQNIPADLFRKGTAKEHYEIKTPIAAITVPGNMFPSASTEKKQQMGISVSYADRSKLKKELADKIGDRPVINIAAYADGKQFEWKNKNAQVTVTIDYTPTEKELKKPGHIVVWYIDGKGNAVPVPNGRYDPATGKLTFKVTHFSIYAVSYVEKTYNDISKAYAKAEIEVLASKGFYDWIESSSFEPNRKITRGEFLYLLITALNIDGTFDDNFSDVDPGDIYYEAAGIAKKYGISNGTGGNKLGAKQGITRQEMATLVARALKAVNREYPAASVSELNKFNDSVKISDYAKESMAILVKAGFLVGYNNSLDPRGTFTMQQAATVIWRIYNN